MRKFKAALLAAGLLLAAAAPSAASATTVIITDVNVGYGNLGDVSVAGYGTPWATPILLTDTLSNLWFVYCADLDHDVGVGGGQSLTYHTGPLTQNGLGQPLTMAVSNEIGQIASIGQYAYNHGNASAAIAAQAAIWQLEYGGVTINFDPGLPDMGQYFANFLQVQDNGRGWADGLLSDVGTQSFALPSVPEPATWTMMLMGVAGLGGMLRLRRREGTQAA